MSKMMLSCDGGGKKSQVLLAERAVNSSIIASRQLGLLRVSQYVFGISGTSVLDAVKAWRYLDRMTMGWLTTYRVVGARSGMLVTLVAA